MDYNCPDVNSKFPSDAQSSYTTTSIPERRIQKADIRVHWLLCINTTDLRYKKTPNKTLRGAMQFTAACTTGHGNALLSAFESSVALAAVINLLVSITFQQKKNPDVQDGYLTCRWEIERPGQDLRFFNTLFKPKAMDLTELTVQLQWPKS